MRVTLQAFSSSGGSYPVDFSDEHGQMLVFCHCQAGITHQMCKHKAALIRGDTKMLFDASEGPKLKQILGSPAYPALKARFDEYETQLAGVEREMAKLKEQEKSIKQAFVYELTHGKPLSKNPAKTYELRKS